MGRITQELGETAADRRLAGDEAGGLRVEREDLAAGIDAQDGNGGMFECRLTQGPLNSGLTQRDDGGSQSHLGDVSRSPCGAAHVRVAFCHANHRVSQEN